MSPLAESDTNHGRALEKPVKSDEQKTVFSARCCGWPCRHVQRAVTFYSFLPLLPLQQMQPLLLLLAMMMMMRRSQ